MRLLWLLGRGICDLLELDVACLSFVFSFLVLDGGQRRWNLNVEQEGQRIVEYMLMEVVARLLYLRQFVVSSDSQAFLIVL